MSQNVVMPYRFATAEAIQWKEIGRTKLTGTADTITVSSLPNYPYLHVLYHAIPSGQISVKGQINSDSDPNYCNRTDYNQGGEDVATASDHLSFPSGTAEAYDGFGVGYVQNLTAQEKMFIGHTVTSMQSGAGYAPSRYESVGKWVNTSDPIDEFGIYNTSSGDLDTDSEVIVLGADPTNTDSTGGFWEELADVSLTGTGDMLDSGTISAKKYLFVECHILSTTLIRTQLQFNSITATEYCNRFTPNGSGNYANLNTDRIYLNDLDRTSDAFLHFHIINDPDREKMVICHDCWQNATGGGTAPMRVETVGKWTNNTSDITSIQIIQDRGGDFAVDTRIKVWGSN